MMKSGFTIGNYDSCVYFKGLKGKLYLYLLLYVDDMLIANQDIELIN